jgi:hypothetical protein
VTPDKSGRGGAYPRGGKVEEKLRGGEAERALVVTGGGDEVLQLGRGEGGEGFA